MDAPDPSPLWKHRKFVFTPTAWRPKIGPGHFWGTQSLNQNIAFLLESNTHIPPPIPQKPQNHAARVHTKSVFLKFGIWIFRSNIFRPHAIQSFEKNYTAKFRTVIFWKHPAPTPKIWPRVQWELLLSPLFMHPTAWETTPKGTLPHCLQ